MSAIEQRPYFTRNRILALIAAAIGSLFLGVTFAKLMPDQAPTWLQHVAQVLVPVGEQEVNAEPLVLAIAVDDPYDGGRGASIVNGVSLFIDDLNESGGIGGRPVAVEVFDDGGEEASARQVAEQIVADDRILAVIGHRISSTSLAAAPVYDAAGMPVITPSATNPAVTAEVDTYFRTIGTDDRNARFIAQYIAKVMRPRQVFVVTHDDPYGQTLTENFITAGEAAGLTIARPVRLGNMIQEVPGMESNADAADLLLDRLRDNRVPTALFFAAYPDEVSPLIRSIRDAHLDHVAMVGPDAFDRPDFAEGFASFMQERRTPGFYTNGFHIATPLIYDTGGREAGFFRERYIARFGESPDWRAGLARDAALVLVEAGTAISAKVAAGELEVENTIERRALLLEEIRAIDRPDVALDGINGPIFFDTDGNPVQAAAVGRLEAGRLISALSQFDALESMQRGQSVDQLIAEGVLIELDGLLMKRSEVVFAGVSIDRVGAVDSAARTAEIGGEIWFRYEPIEPIGVEAEATKEGLLPASSVSFLNAAGEVSYEPVEVRETRDGMYEKFRFDGTFYIDFVEDARRYGRPIVGVSFRHQSAPTTDLVYVVDLLGMGLMDGGTFEEQLDGVRGPLEAQGWDIAEAATYQDVAWAPIQGNPLYLGQPAGLLPFSEFTAALRLQSVNAIGSELIGRSQTIAGMLAAGALLILTLLWRAFAPFFPRAIVPILAQALAVFVLLWLAERIAIGSVEGSWPLQRVDWVAKGFAVARWLAGAYFLVAFLDAVWDGVERRTGRAVPQLLRLLDHNLIYLGALFCILAFVFKLPVTSLLAATGLVGLTIGLALQGNLANVFSGLTLSAERPFGVGDVIEVGGQGPLRVKDMGWRSVRLVTPTGEEISIPNNDLAAAVIRNKSTTPGGVGGAGISVRLPVDVPSNWAKNEISAAMAEADGVRQDLPNGISIGGVSLVDQRWATTYNAWWKVDDPATASVSENEVWNLVLQRFEKEGIMALLVADSTQADHRERPKPRSWVEGRHVDYGDGDEAEAGAAAG